MQQRKPPERPLKRRLPRRLARPRVRMGRMGKRATLQANRPMTQKAPKTKQRRRKQNRKAIKTPPFPPGNKRARLPSRKRRRKPRLTMLIPLSKLPSLRRRHPGTELSQRQRTKLRRNRPRRTHRRQQTKILNSEHDQQG